jgi:hypothetical protein
MMKNILFAILLSGLLFACGGNAEKDTPQEEPATQEQVETAEAPATDTVAAPVEEGKTETATETEATTGAKEEATKTTSKVTSGGWTGKVVKLADVTTGNYEALTAARVKALVMAGQYVGFLSDGTFYMVFNGAGNYDWKSLAKVADKASVTIEGKLKKVNGVSVIVATKVS